MVDRLTYCELRKQEKNTAKAIGHLIEDNAFQNYRIVHDWTDHLQSTDADKDIFIAASKAARGSYQSDIKAQGDKYAGEVRPLQFHRLDKLFAERETSGKTGARTGREIESEEKGLLMAVCGVAEPGQIAKVRTIKLKRLFAEAMPFISDQFDSVKFPGWQLVAAEKSEKIGPLLKELKSLRLKEIDGFEFAIRMRNIKGVREAVVRLANNDSDYKHWNDRLATLDSLGDEKRSRASHDQRFELTKKEFEIAKEFLATLGIYFEKSKGGDGRQRIDPALPVVPNWDFDQMAKNLEIKARALKRLPEGSTCPPYDIEETWTAGPMVRKSKCQRCVYYWHQSCTLGKRAQWFDDEPDVLLTHYCGTYVQIPARLAG